MEAKVSFPLRVKFSLIFIFLITILFGISFFLISTLAVKSSVQNSMVQSQTVNSRTALAIQNEIEKLYQETQTLINSAENLSVYSSQTFDAELLPFVENFFSVNNSIYLVYSDFFGLKINEVNLKKNHETENFFVKQINDKKDGLYNISGILNEASLLYIFSIRKGNSIHKSAVAFSTRFLRHIIATGKIFNSCIINTNKEILVSLDLNNSLEKTQLNYKKLDEFLTQEKFSSTSFIDTEEPFNHKIICTLDKLNYEKKQPGQSPADSEYYVLTVQDYKENLLAIKKIQLLIIFLFVFVLSLGLLVINIFTKKIVTSIEQITEALRFVEAGKFNLELPVKGGDEFSVLTDTFNHTALSLEDFRNTNRISSKKLLKNKSTVEGTLMLIRLENFTLLPEFSDSQQSEEILKIYLNIVSAAVSKGKGRILLQNQDEVYCLWSNEDFSSMEEACWNAVKTTFILRYEFFVLNKERKNLQKKTLRINTGISTGKIVLTFSEHTENHTPVIKGHTALLASNASILNQKERTDIILEETSFKLIKDKIIYSRLESEKTDFSSQQYYILINAAGMKGPQNINQLIKAL